MFNLDGLFSCLSQRYCCSNFGCSVATKYLTATCYVWQCTCASMLAINGHCLLVMLHVNSTYHSISKFLESVYTKQPILPYVKTVFSKPFKKVGSFCWLSLAICIVELLMCIKFGHGECSSNLRASNL
jgi:hypothetical protein